MPERKAQLAILFLLLSGCSKAQGPSPEASRTLAGKLTPGETLRYEIETSTSYSASIDQNYTTNLPLGPCQYSLGAQVTLNVGPAASDSNLPVKATYRDVRVTSWHCAELNKNKLERELRDLTSSRVVYQAGPHGEVSFRHNASDRFSYSSAIDLLTKTTLDLLQTHLSERPVSPGAAWKPHGQFMYWKDKSLTGLEVSAATMHWKNNPVIAGQDYACIATKYVFAPTENSSGPVTAGGSLRQEPTNVLAGVLNVTLLLDPQSQRIAWLSRHYKVENHVSIQPEEEPDPEIMTVRWEEEAKARLLPEKNSITWLAALKAFESTPEPSMAGAPTVSGTGPSFAELARKAVPRKTSSTDAMDTLDFTPQGFSRWEREFCNSSSYCTSMSIALPGEVKIADDGQRQIAYFAQVGGSLVTVTVGPVLPRKNRGLTSDEELKKHTDFYLANQIWMANKPGIAVDSQNSSVDGYPARLTTFRGERRDLIGIQGELAVLLSPWGESFPVTCTVEQTTFAKLHATCERILGLIRLRREE